MVDPIFSCKSSPCLETGTTSARFTQGTRIAALITGRHGHDYPVVFSEGAVKGAMDASIAKNGEPFGATSWVSQPNWTGWFWKNCHKTWHFMALGSIQSQAKWESEWICVWNRYSNLLISNKLMEVCGGWFYILNYVEYFWAICILCNCMCNLHVYHCLPLFSLQTHMCLLVQFRQRRAQAMEVYNSCVTGWWSARSSIYFPRKLWRTPKPGRQSSVQWCFHPKAT